ncbi:hypothetical protein ACLOJK_010855 [Asimina triloba]
MHSFNIKSFGDLSFVFGGRTNADELEETRKCIRIRSCFLKPNQWLELEVDNVVVAWQPNSHTKVKPSSNHITASPFSYCLEHPFHRVKTMATTHLNLPLLILLITLALASHHVLSRLLDGPKQWGAFPPTCNRIECPTFDVIYAGDGFEIRRYNSAMWTSTAPIDDISFVAATRAGFLQTKQGISYFFALLKQSKFQSRISPESGKRCETGFGFCGGCKRPSPKPTQIAQTQSALGFSEIIHPSSFALIRLFDYIQGNNENQEKIEMTAPVITEISPSDGPFCASSFVVSFFLPQKNQANPPPAQNLHTQRWGVKYAAVRQFSGFVADDDVGKEAAALQESLAGSPWAAAVDKARAADPTSMYTVAQYNSPFEFENRVNEIWMMFDIGDVDAAKEK